MTNGPSSTSSLRSAPTPSKVCKTCEKNKPVTEFYKRTGTKDGYQYYCKQCQRTRQTSGAADSLPAEYKHKIYTAAIERMRHFGIMSPESAREALERVSVD